MSGQFFHPQSNLANRLFSKYFTFEKAYADKIDQLRRSELRGIRMLLMIRAMNTAVAFSLPVMSAVIAFCCYIGT